MNTVQNKMLINRLIIIKEKIQHLTTLEIKPLTSHLIRYYELILTSLPSKDTENFMPSESSR